MDHRELFGAWRERPAGIQAEGLRARLQFILMSYAGLAGIVAVGLMVALVSASDGERLLLAAQQAVEIPAGRIEHAIGGGAPVAREVVAADGEQEGLPLAGAALAATPRGALSTRSRPAADPRPTPAHPGAELQLEPPALAALPSGPLAIGPGLARPFPARTAALPAQPTASTPDRAPELAAPLPPGLEQLAGSAAQRLSDARAAALSGSARRPIDPTPSGQPPTGSSAPERLLPWSPGPAASGPAQSPVPTRAPPTGAGTAPRPSPSVAAPVSAPAVPAAHPSPAAPAPSSSPTALPPAPTASPPAVATPPRSTEPTREPTKQPAAPTATPQPTAEPPRSSAAVPTASTPRDEDGRDELAGPGEQQRHQREERRDERAERRDERDGRQQALQHLAPAAPDRSAASAAPPSAKPAPAKSAPPATPAAPPTVQKEQPPPPPAAAPKQAPADPAAAPPAAQPKVAHPAATARAAASKSRPAASAPARPHDPPKGRT